MGLYQGHGLELYLLERDQKFMDSGPQLKHQVRDINFKSILFFYTEKLNVI